MALILLLVLLTFLLLPRLRPRLGALLVVLSLALVGMGLSQIELVRLTAPLSLLERFSSPELQPVRGKVVSLVKRTSRGVVFVLQARELAGQPLPRPVRLATFVRLPEKGEAAPPDLLWLDQVSLRCSLSPPDPPDLPGGFDQRIWIWTQGASLLCFVPKPEMVEVESPSHHPLALVVELSARTLFGAVYRYLPPERADLFISLIYGDKVVQLDPVVKEDFRRSGLMHILVVSGSQLSLLAAWLWLMLRPLAWWGRGWGGRVVANLLVIAGLVWFALLTGYQLSIQRALFMALALIISRLFLDLIRVLDSLAVAALVVALINPLVPLSPSFQLSFGATLGLILALYAAYPFLETLNRVERYFAGVLIATLGAQIAVAPIIAVHFNQLTPIGPLSNLVAIPLSALILVVGTLANLSWMLSLPLVSPLLAHLSGWLVELLRQVAHLFAHTPLSATVVRAPPLWVVVTFYLATALAAHLFWLWARGKPPAPAVRGALSTLLILLTLWWGAGELPAPSRLILAHRQGYRTAVVTQGRRVLFLLVELPASPRRSSQALEDARRLVASLSLAGSPLTLLLSPRPQPSDLRTLYFPASLELTGGQRLHYGGEALPLELWADYPPGALRPSWQISPDNGLTLLAVGDHFNPTSLALPATTDTLIIMGTPGRILSALEALPSLRCSTLNLVITAPLSSRLEGRLTTLGSRLCRRGFITSLGTVGWLQLDRPRGANFNTP